MVRAGVVTGMPCRTVISSSLSGDRWAITTRPPFRALGTPHVDPGSSLGQQIPQNGSTEVAQDRAISGREDRG
jgi:hypothetical protein